MTVTVTMDTVLSQAMVCAYAVPVVGGGVAAVFSMLQAASHAIPSDGPTTGWSAAQAIADLGQKMHDELQAVEDDELLAAARGWQLDLTTAGESTPGYAIIGAHDFLADHDFSNTFGKFFKAEEDTDHRVQLLDNYFLARTTYHGLCTAWLDRLEAGRKFDPVTTAVYTEEIHTRYRRSLTEALDYVRGTVEKLDAATQNARQQAEAKATAAASGQIFAEYARNYALAQELRRIRYDDHLRFAPPSVVESYRQLVLLYDTTFAGLTAATAVTNSVTTAGATAGVQAGDGAAVATLGPRQPGTARFLYESDPGGGWVNVVGDSPVAVGSIVAQNAGSTLHDIYYEVGGEFLNGTFATQITAADPTLLGRVNADLKDAYNARYNGAYDTDAAGRPPPQDRLTSFLIMLDPGVPPIGKRVLGMLYSVGPQLGAKGIEDEAAYKQIYTDGLTAIADWNTSNATIENLRVALLSTGAFGGSSDGPTLRAQAAGLVIDAAVAAMKARPEIGSLQLLINTNDTTTTQGPERIAFDTAAKARKITTFAQGFDVRLS